MKDDIERLREMSEDTLRVLDVAEQMVNSTYQRLRGLLRESEQENDRLRQRIDELEAKLGESASDTAIIERRAEDTHEVGPRIYNYSVQTRGRSSNLAETLELK